MHAAYQWVKFLHELGTVLFAGWVLFAPSWMAQSLQLAGAEALARIRRRVTALTLVAIGGGGALLWGTGVLMARVLSPDAFGLHWLRAGSALFAAAALGWLLILLPWYRALVAARLGGDGPSGRALLAWRLGAVAAMALTLASLWMMVVRP